MNAEVPWSSTYSTSVSPLRSVNVALSGWKKTKPSRKIIFMLTASLPGDSRSRRQTPTMAKLSAIRKMVETTTRSIPYFALVAIQRAARAFATEEVDRLSHIGTQVTGT